jgi:hypothetical protein
MRWAGNAGDYNTVLVRKPERKRPVGILGVDERIILKSILKKYGVRIGNGLDS